VADDADEASLRVTSSRKGCGQDGHNGMLSAVQERPLAVNIDSDYPPVARVPMRRVNADALAMTGWWKRVSPERVVGFQAFCEQMCMPSPHYRDALAAVLGRAISEQDLKQPNALCREILGHRRQPSFDEILACLPEHARWIVTTAIPEDEALLRARAVEGRSCRSCGGRVYFLPVTGSCFCEECGERCGD